MSDTKKLKKKIKELEEALEKERESHEKTKEEFKKTQEEFEEFKAKHALTVTNLRKAMKIKANNKIKPQPLGAPKGHKGYARHVPERIDNIKALILKKCPHCQTKLSCKTQEIRSRHVTDIKLTSKVKNTRYDIHRKYCPKCKKLVEPEVPNVLPHARFGLNLMLLIMYLKLGLRLPCNKICDYLYTLYNLTMSEGEIVVILRQLAREFGDYYIHLEKIVKLARVKHSDTTSWRVNGKNYFAWVFIACGIVLYKIRKRNNHKVALTVLGNNQKNNILVVDRHQAFRTLADKTGLLLQYCWSHILEDTKEFARDFGSEGKYIPRKMKEIYALAKGLKQGTPGQVEQLKGELFQLVIKQYKHNIIKKYLRKLYNPNADNLFRFVTDPEVDSTNNISERELRALVIIRKISNGSRSPRGANSTAMLLSIIQTLRFNKKNVLHGLQEILNNASGY